MVYRQIRVSSLPETLRRYTNIKHINTWYLHFVRPEDLVPNDRYEWSASMFRYINAEGNIAHARYIVNIRTGQALEHDKWTKRGKQVPLRVFAEYNRVELNDLVVITEQYAVKGHAAQYEVRMTKATFDKYVQKDPIDLPPQVASMLYIFANVRAGNYRKKAFEQFELRYGAGSKLIWTDWLQENGLITMNKARALTLTPRGVEFASRIPDDYSVSLWDNRDLSKEPLHLDGVYVGTFAGLLGG